jgi:hypothetical protein
MSKELNPPGSLGEWCRLMGWIMTYEEDYQKDQAEIKHLRKALTKIAAFGDKGACELLKNTGSWGTFDEPESVQVARAALKGESE